MYILECIQGDDTFKVGLFETEEDIHAWLQAVPFINCEQYEVEGVTFTTYTMKRDAMPEYAEVEWNGYVFPLTKYMLLDGEREAMFVWYDLHRFDFKTSNRQLIDGMTRVDAYTVPNEEVKEYVAARNALFEEACTYYRERGKRVERAGYGSEDGEYVLVDGQFFFHLDAMNVAYRQDVETFEQFIHAYIIQ